MKPRPFSTRGPGRVRGRLSVPRRRAIGSIVSVLAILLLALAAAVPASAYDGGTATVWAEPSVVNAGQPVVVKAEVQNVQAAWLENVPVVNNYAQLVDYPCATRVYTLNVQYRDGSYRQQQTQVNVRGTCGGYAPPVAGVPYYTPGYARPVPGFAAPSYSYIGVPFSAVWPTSPVVYAGQPVTIQAQVRNVQAAWLENVPVVNNYAQLTDYPCRSRTYTLNVQYRDGTTHTQQTRVTVLNPTC